MDPKDPGPSLPPAGRSLFDFVVSGPGGPGTVPFPFAALTRLIESALGRSEDPLPVRRVLIPLSRSLQRNAARPDFFTYPRVVMAVDGERAPRGGHAAPLLRDRLFLGYQEKAGIIEVISYNEAAGRFEFQVVKDYRPGGAPQVFYANRAVCVVCHQNHAPIFSRQLWDETSANPRIAALLRTQGRRFYGVSLDQGVDIPYGIDNATARANALSAYQRLWQDGCGGGAPLEAIECRASLFILALQYRLSGSRQVDTRASRYHEGLAPRLAHRWQELWPRGLAVPDPTIPNRDALADLGGAVPLPVSLSAGDERLRELLKQAGVHARFEPSNPRAPLETWWASDQATDTLDRAIAGLGSFLARADIQRLDRHLVAWVDPAEARQTSHESPCEFELVRREGARHRLTFRCGGPESGARGVRAPWSVDGAAYFESGRVVAGSIDRARFKDGDELRDLDVVHGWVRISKKGLSGELEVRQRFSGLHARRADGSAVRRISVWGDPGQPRAGVSDGSAFPGRATILLVDDFEAVRAAVMRMAGLTSSGKLDVFAAWPFRRASLMRALEGELGMARPLEWCCVDDRGLAPARLEDGSAPGAPPAVGTEQPDTRAVALFARYCAQCHRTRDTFPPNFLTGPPTQVRVNLAQCAERIFFRLSMWGVQPEARLKSPMPPVYALLGVGITDEQWPDHRDLQALRDYVGGVLRSETGRDPRPEDLMTRSYEHLRTCLPAQASR